MEFFNTFRTRGGILKYIQDKRRNSLIHSEQKAEFLNKFWTRGGILKYIQDKRRNSEIYSVQEAEFQINWGQEANFFKIFRTKEGILKYIQDKRWNSQIYSRRKTNSEIYLVQEAEFLNTFRTRGGILKHIQDKTLKHIPQSTNLSVRSAVICSTLTEDIVESDSGQEAEFLNNCAQINLYQKNDPILKHKFTYQAIYLMLSFIFIFFKIIFSSVVSVWSRTAPENINIVYSWFPSVPYSPILSWDWRKCDEEGEGEDIRWDRITYKYVILG